MKIITNIESHHLQVVQEYYENSKTIVFQSYYSIDIARKVTPCEIGMWKIKKLKQK